MTYHEGTEVEYGYSSTISLALVLNICGLLTQRLSRFAPVNDTVPIVWKDMCVPVLVWMGVGDFASTGIRSPDRRVLSESLYLLRFSGPQIFNDASIFVSQLLILSELRTENNFVASW